METDSSILVDEKTLAVKAFYMSVKKELFLTAIYL